MFYAERKSMFRCSSITTLLVIFLYSIPFSEAQFSNNRKEHKKHTFYDNLSDEKATTEVLKESSVLDARSRYSIPNTTLVSANIDNIREEYDYDTDEDVFFDDAKESFPRFKPQENSADKTTKHYPVFYSTEDKDETVYKTTEHYPVFYPTEDEDKTADEYENYDYDDYYSIIDDTNDYAIYHQCNMTQTDDSDLNKRSAESMTIPSTSSHETTTNALQGAFNLSDEFLNCMLTTVEPECYQQLGNGSVYVPVYDMVFNRGNYMISNNILLLCPDFFETFEEKFSSTIDIISVVGALISAVFIVLHIIMFFLVDKMRNLPGYCMFSMCLALLTVYISSFTQFQMSDHANCSAIGMIIYYSLLSSYFWMNVISYDVWQSIRLATSKLRLCSERPVVARFCLYSLYAWGTPIVIVVASIVTDYITTDERYKLEFNEHTCWFKNKTALLVYFALPLFIVLFVDIMFFITSFYMIQRSIMSKSSCGGQSSKSSLRSRLFLTLKLGTAMGLMWIFGVIATLTQREWLYYLYSIFNALQGVFIFLSFSVNEKTIQAFKMASNMKNHSILQRPFPKPSFYRTTTQTESGS